MILGFIGAASAIGLFAGMMENALEQDGFCTGELQTEFCDQWSSSNSSPLVSDGFSWGIQIGFWYCIAFNKIEVILNFFFFFERIYLGTAVIILILVCDHIRQCRKDSRNRQDEGFF